MSVAGEVDVGGHCCRYLLVDTAIEAAGGVVIQYGMLYRWFVDLEWDDGVWHVALAHAGGAQV